MKTHKQLIPVLLCTLILVGFFQNINAQTQKGNDIYGEANDDWSGWSVSMPDANTIAIGAHFNDGSGSTAGHVRIYSWSGSAWIQKGGDIDGEAAVDQSGYSVSMPDANTVAIGAVGNKGNGIDAGHVRIYSWNVSAWKWIQKGGDIDGEAARDQSGYSVSMPDANTVAIGAPYNYGHGNDSGHVRIYSWSGSAWIQKGDDIDGEAVHDLSGSSVSMPDANTVAIGAPANDGNGNNSGHVRIYSWNGSAWIQKGGDIDGEATFDNSGQSVSMPDANTIAIGAARNNGNRVDAGHVRIYSWNGSAWIQKGGDIDGEAADDISGWSVSMPDANTLAIGAPLNNGNGVDAGHVRIYSWNGSAWKQEGGDIDGEAAGDVSGWSVSMPDAYTVAIGARLNDGNGFNAGHVRVYEFCRPTTATISPTACDSYRSPSTKHTWTASGTYIDTIVNTAGCDSVITINLTINTVDISVTNSSPTLSADATGASYRWLDCNDSMFVISGDTDRSFTATSNGSYAVEVTQNGCVDTSSCVAIVNVGIKLNDFNTVPVVFPNPAGGDIELDLGKVYSRINVVIRSELGKEISRKGFSNSANLKFTIHGKAGVYFIEITADNEKTLLKVIKE